MVARPIAADSLDNSLVKKIAVAVWYHAAKTDKIKWFRTLYYKRTTYIDFTSLYNEEETEIKPDNNDVAPLKVVKNSLSDISKYVPQKGASLSKMTGRDRIREEI